MNTTRSTLTLARASASSSKRDGDYQTELSRAMSLLAADDRVVFIGQGVEDKGTFMSTTLHHLPLSKRLELPVAEEMQAGMAIGLALDGYVPVCIYPRWNFLILATNQLVNHLDKMQAHVIVRVGVGSTEPLHPGPQHVGNFATAFELMCPDTYLAVLGTPEKIVPEYRAALKRDGPSILVEIADLYES